MFTISRHLKCVFLMQKCLQTFVTARCVVHSEYIRSHESKCSILSLSPSFRRTISLPYQRYLFSTRVPKRGTRAVLQSDYHEKNNNNTVKDYDILVSVITKGKRLSSSEWDAIKDQTYSTSRIINVYNIDAIIIRICSKFMQLDMGLSYLEHLSVSRKKLNIATIGHIMKMCYTCRVKGIDEQLVLSMYEDLRSRCPVLDANTAECMILGLCCTKCWKEGLNLLDTIKLTSAPGAREHNALVMTAFNNNEPNISQRLIDEMLQLGQKIRPEVYHAWLEYCDRAAESQKLERWRMVEEMLKMFVENDLKPTMDVAERIRDWYKEIVHPNTEVYAELTTLTERGICKSCQKYLDPIIITKEEFRVLQSVFMDKVLVGRDVFCKTTPEEIKEFKNFLKMTAPYDMVIDGLNIAFSSSGKPTPRTLPRTLQLVVKHFVMKSKKVLVLGRKHMQTWAPHYMDYIYRNAHVFLAENLSQDDPFLLCAALYSGMGTRFISRDLMRGHAYLLQDESLRSTFRRWQLQHQCQLKHVTEAGKLYIKSPLTFSPTAQVSNDGSWHLPYDTEFGQNPGELFEVPSTWLCLRADKSSQVR